MRIIPLQAAHGDAIIVEAEKEGRIYRIIIDGGPEETADDIAKCYVSLGHIDLLILTHYDNDHITGILRYLECLNGIGCVVDTVWANCASIMDYDDEENASAYDDAYVLSILLRKLKRKGLIGEWLENVTTEMGTITVGPFMIDILSPTPEIQCNLLKKYRDYIDEHELEDDPDEDEEVSFARVQQEAAKEFSTLVSNFRPTSTTFMNRSSIALRVQADGQTVLLLGDADAKIIADTIERMGASEDNPMRVDMVKVSHHGSKANINRKLFTLIECSNYLFATNGGTGGAYHPDRQTIACIDKWASHDELLTLYFNYPLDVIMKRNVGLLKDTEKERFRIVEGQNAITV